MIPPNPKLLWQSLIRYSTINNDGTVRLVSPLTMLQELLVPILGQRYCRYYHTSVVTQFDEDLSIWIWGENCWNWTANGKFTALGSVNVRTPSYILVIETSTVDYKRKKKTFTKQQQKIAEDISVCILRFCISYIYHCMYVRLCYNNLRNWRNSLFHIVHIIWN